MHSTKLGLTLGFHGCDQSVSTQLLHHKIYLKPSENDYDWLGSGMYFWGTAAKELAIGKYRLNNSSECDSGGERQNETLAKVISKLVGKQFRFILELGLPQVIYNISTINQ